MRDPHTARFDSNIRHALVSNSKKKVFVEMFVLLNIRSGVDLLRGAEFRPSVSRRLRRFGRGGPGDRGSWNRVISSTLARGTERQLRSVRMNEES